MADKEFIFEKTVYLTDTNFFGNTYFARYFDWQGMAREAFLKEIIGDAFSSLMQSRIKFVTIEASIKYQHETTLFDEVVINVKVENIKAVTAELVFTYKNKKTNAPVAEGRQKIGFVDSAGKVITIPKPLIDGWNKYKQS
jgi:YbgC/YbaW family acyl-CoA thioester hydrolase